jgi:tRNA(Ile)-lysidine synthase
MHGLTEVDLEAIFAPVAAARSIALAVSGGADSMALMLLAHEWATGRPDAPALSVYSVDHRLRPEAADEAAKVVGEAFRLGLSARVLTWDGDKPRTGVQAAARAARYRLMAAAMIEDGVEFVLTAHHVRDQAETVLMRLAHGSGVEGLRGMDRFATVEGCRIFRPLLELDPEVLAGVVNAAGVTPAQDPSNQDRHYERVRWRQIAPALAELGLDATRLSRFASRMGDADALIESEAARAYSVLVHKVQGRAALPRAGLAALPRAVGVRLFGKVLAEIGSGGKPHALGAVERLLERLSTPEAQRAATLHGCIIASDGVTISVTREGARRGRSELISG